MTEIIVAIILYISTILGGVPADKEKSKDGNSERTNKEKVENPSDTARISGGSGNWEDGGR